MDELPEHTSALYHSLREGSKTSSALAKKAKVSQDDVEETLRQWQTQRAWVTSEPKGKGKVWSLTNVGRGMLEARHGA
ncbi:MAG TPA: hypothetical protein VGP44_00620 [Gemmatimonadales bacterium]|nr:hypothetical protein [Gemmatimonadales bacterium]